MRQVFYYLIIIILFFIMGCKSEKKRFIFGINSSVISG